MKEDIQKRIRENLNENSQTEDEIVKQVRAAWADGNKLLNKEYPISVSINGIKRIFLVSRKSVSRSARLGAGEPKLYLRTMVFGRMLKGDAPENLWNHFEITEKNVFKTGGYPKVATKEEIETFGQIFKNNP